MHLRERSNIKKTIMCLKKNIYKKICNPNQVQTLSSHKYFSHSNRFRSTSFISHY